MRLLGRARPFVRAIARVRAIRRVRTIQLVRRMPRAAAGGALVAALALATPAHPADEAISPKAQALAHTLDTMGVETKWASGVHVDWETGLPDGVPERLPGRHTHCSAFVAAAAKKLGVYILRPPQHGQVLLANAQNEWLAGDGRAAGWRPLNGPVEAQAAANRGLLVVASYHNHHDNKPGHIAIVRPGTKGAAQIAAEGPDAIQAGAVNSTAISIRDGFAGHPAAWNNNEIVYYAHDVTF
jgi:hypothetical protein